MVRVTEQLRQLNQAMLIECDLLSEKKTQYKSIKAETQGVELSIQAQLDHNFEQI